MPKAKVKDRDGLKIADRHFNDRKDVVSFPDLIALQKDSYNWFLREGIKELFDEISPVEDLTGRNLELYFTDYYFEEPKYDEATAREMDTTYEASLRVKLRLINKNTGEIKEQEVFFGDMPQMTKSGTFIINGVERVVVSQLVRSSGTLFTRTEGGKFGLYGAKIIPDHGAWLEVETAGRGYMVVKVDRKKKLYLTTILRAFGLGSDEEIIDTFKDVNTDPEHDFIKATLEKDPSHNEEQGLIEFYKKMRPGDPPTLDNAKTLFVNMFQNFRRYDLGRVGRYKLNQRLMLGVKNDKGGRVLYKEDIVAIAKEVIRLNNEGGPEDDVDHLKNRRVRAVGELAQQRFRIGLLRVERMIKDRMSTSEVESLTPAQLINARPVTAIMQEFFGSFQLSQFMDQQNPLSELENKRRLSATGPGGLHRERAGFEVRDVHPSHYGRICPIATPEGASIGLTGHLASFAKVNEFGFIETPYRKILQEVPNDGKSLVGHVIFQDIVTKNKKILAKGGTEADERLTREIARHPEITAIKIQAEASKEVIYLDAHEEESVVIAQPNIRIDERGRILDAHVLVRRHGEPSLESIGRVDYMDVSPKQIISIGTALIPFIEHDDARRALMGTNMQRQAVPLVNAAPPIVSTGMETVAALGSGWVHVAPADGKILWADGNRIEFEDQKGKKTTFYLTQFARSNADTVLHQTPLVEKGQVVKKGDILCDGPAITDGRLSLGQNLLVAFMPWEGANFEDAIIISERLVRDDILTSIHIKREVVDVRDTKLGSEITTRDIPNVGEEAVANLDEDGIIRIGAVVRSHDILVGKITPKGETELTAEERLLRAIFGEKVKDVKDTSLRLPHGGYGKIIGIKIFDREKGDKLEVGVLKRIYVYIAQLRKVSVGDKLAGRHGNKGVISKILPEADMPHLADGTPVDIILNSLGVISRMNIGQVLETHLGWAAYEKGYRAIVPAFEGPSVAQIADELREAHLPADGKIQLYDGRTGEPFEQRVTVGCAYIMKLIHMVDDKIHARSIGPYALVTQQPLGGKAQQGGQRLGEMEVWALEGYGAAHTLQEMLTIKSDDVLGRAKAYEAIIRGEEIQKPRTPEAFNVIAKELQGLGLSVNLLDDDELNQYEKKYAKS